MAIKATSQVSLTDVTDAYSVTLTSEAYVFMGDNESGAPAGLSCTTQVIAYRGSQQCTNINVGKIQCPTGISAKIENNGTSVPTITFTTTAAITDPCEATIPVTVDDVSFTKIFSFAIATSVDDATLELYLKKDETGTLKSMIEAIADVINITSKGGLNLSGDRFTLDSTNTKIRSNGTIISNGELKHNDVIRKISLIIDKGSIDIYNNVTSGGSDDADNDGVDRESRYGVINSYRYEGGVVDSNTNRHMLHSLGCSDYNTEKMNYSTLYLSAYVKGSPATAEWYEAQCSSGRQASLYLMRNVKNGNSTSVNTGVDLTTNHYGSHLTLTDNDSYIYLRTRINDNINNAVQILTDNGRGIICANSYTGKQCVKLIGYDSTYDSGYLEILNSGKRKILLDGANGRAVASVFKSSSDMQCNGNSCIYNGNHLLVYNANNSGYTIALRGSDGMGFFRGIEATSTCKLGTTFFVGDGIEIYHTYPHIDFHKDNSNADFTARLIEEVSGSIFLRCLGNGMGWFHAGGYAQDSSKYVKKNIQDIPEDEALKLLQLRPVSFDYKKGDTNRRGLIAEEVMDIYPELVQIPDGYDEDTFEYDEEGPNLVPSLDYSGFIPYLIKMVQIQQKEIEDLKEQVSELSKKLV